MYLLWLKTHFTWCVCALCRYVLKVTVSRGYGGSVVEYQDFVVRFFYDLSPHTNTLSFPLVPMIDDVKFCKLMIEFV